MRIGFIGAGKVGCSLGRYFSHASTLVGYASKSATSAQEAAALTGSLAFESAAQLCAECDVVFITTPDGRIADAWKKVAETARDVLPGKTVCHCSGAMPTQVFTGANEMGVNTCSVHPLFAISSKTLSEEELSHAFFTLEGNEEGVRVIAGLLDTLGNPYQSIPASEKTRYHAAAALASNHVVGLYRLASDELVRCGFSPERAEAALAPLFLGNAEHIAHDGTVAALTGPAERGDMATIEKHLACLDGNTREVYRLLNETLLQIAEEKHH